MRDRDRARVSHYGILSLAVAGVSALLLIGDNGLPAPPTAAMASTPARSKCVTGTRDVVRRFTRAIRDANADRADDAFAPEPAFQWYSTTAPGARLNAAAVDRTTLRAYFRDRVARHERLRHIRLTTFYERRRNITHFHGTLARNADDLVTTTQSLKGAATCRGRVRIIVWSMASSANNR